MIGLFNTIKDNIGLLWLSNYQTTGDYLLNSRIIRSKTLEGDTIYTHLGTNETDREITIEGNFSVDMAEKIKAMQLNNSEIILSLWDGAFRCFIYSVNLKRNNEAKIKFYIKERIDA